MADKKDLNVGDKVKHRFRTCYQRCSVIEVEDGCNGLIKISCEDGFFGGEEESTFCPQDLNTVSHGK
jgi:hypothetical protein